MALTVTVAVEVLVEAQPLAPMTVSEYVVVDAGFAIGVQLAALERPVAGSHAHDTPPEPIRPIGAARADRPPPEAAAVGRPLMRQRRLVGRDRLAEAVGHDDVVVARVARDRSG